MATIIYATFGIPLTLLTIAQVGKYMAAVFRFTYKNLVCRLGGGACTCCSDVVNRDVTGQTSADHTDDKSNSSTEPHLPTYSQLQVEGRAQGQGEVEGHEDKSSDSVNRRCSEDGEVVELKHFTGKHV